MRLVSIVGARPQFVKHAPVARAIAHRTRLGQDVIEDVIVHTGQHYDDAMSRIFFDELGIPTPALNLEVGSAPHGKQTADMLGRIETVLAERRPDLVVVYGDTNSTLAGALAAAKLCVPLAHVEAGLRSFRRSMPEEVNRIVADHISDLLLAPTWTAMKNLAAENLAERAVRVGDVMRDAVLHNRGLAEQRSQILSRLDLEPRQYGVVTIHRAENTVPDRLGLLVDALNRVAQDCLPLVFPVHPRARSLIGERAEEGSSRLRLVEPLGYLDMLRLTGGAALALTDSGGLQKEAMFLDCPCITLRRETEWPETVKCGANRLVRGDGEAILRAVEDVLSERSGGRQDFSAAVTRHFGDGHAADRIVEELVHFASS